ncbi:MAG: propionyl-CoA synthetase [Intrasporangium sp.]|uniref:propionyl-CoA synthetase n=1 Tax=Intrasporangium sp. TaxID=1925024 RepID=UPI003F7F54F2
MGDGASTAAYGEIYRRSLSDPEGFWRDAAADIDWITPPERILDADNPPFYRWYPDAVVNVCHNAVDRHVEAGRGDQAAIHYDSPVTGSRRTITYAELLDDVRAVAGGLTGLGVQQGDRVVIYMPMVPEAVVAMLACARIGAVHSVVFGGFAPQELAARIDDAAPRVVLSASCGVEPTRVVPYKPFLDEAIKRSDHQPEHCVILQREQLRAEMGERDIDWDELVSSESARAGADCVPVASTDPLYILYTSGTTGKPKGIYRDSGGYAVALRWSMKNLYDISPGDTMFTASDIGWVVGHSYIVYGPLLTGATTILYEGKPVGTPDAGAFWRVIQDYGVAALFTAPTAFRAIKKEDADGALLGGYDLSGFRTLYLAGERLDPDTYEWASARLGVPVIDNWWQTETGWPIACNPKGIELLPIKPGSPTVAVCGYDVRILDVEGNEAPAGAEGAICIRLPMPPGTLPTLWQDDERYVSSYLSAYPGHYLTGDGGYFDEDGYLFVMGRTDDVLNVAGHRLSTGSIEAALAGHEAVAECAVIGVRDELKGQVPRALVVLKSGIDAQAEGDRIRTELVARVRAEVGAVAALHQVDIVGGLPKTRSGKILRKTMREIADGANPAVPATIEDASVLEVLGPVLRGH